MDFASSFCRRFGASAAGTVAVVALSIMPALAQPLSDFNTAERRVAPVTRIEASQAPIIDGSLSDPIWQQIPDIGAFRQMEPVYGGVPTERTVVRVAYDENYLYIGIYAYDSEPDAIIATQKVHDGSIFRDDHVKVLIDPNLTRRNAYSFEVNSLGGYTDGLVQNNTDFIRNWNVIWLAAGQRVEDGWTGEMAIPFRSISFDPSSSDWGFDVYRWIRRKNENVRWSRRPLGAGNNDVSLAGTLTGFEGLSQGVGLDVQVFGVTRYTHFENQAQRDGITFRPSGNLYYKITPSLTGLLTMNTDFSDSPLDTVQVNTTRFSLFQQETRQFFLQDASSFEFGGRAFSSGFGGGGQVNNGRPFFSRNIGLVNGRPVSLVFGGKLSGQYEGINIGALSVQTHDPQTGNDEVLSVARLAFPVLVESQAGVIVTHGDPTGNTTNSLAGADFQYAVSDFLGAGQRLQGTAFYLRSFSSLYDEDDEFGGSLLYPNEPWGGEFHYKQIGTNFRPALGFANRRGIKEYRANGTYIERYGMGPMRNASIQLQNSFVTDLGNDLQSRDNSIWVESQMNSGDTYQIVVGNIFEHVLVPFTLPDGVVVPAGRYSWNYFSPRIEFSINRPLSGNIDFDCCDFFNGTNFHSEININWLPNETFGFQFSHRMDLIRLPTGGVDIHILELNTHTNFTPRMYLGTTVQYDNISRQFNFLAQYRWEYEPGQTIFVALGESATIESFADPHYVSQSSTALIRLGRTYRF